MNNTNLHKDFYKIENMKFDISKLQSALHEVLKIKKYDTAGGISHFGAICLNQIPGQPDSIKGNKARGIFGLNLIILEKKLKEIQLLMSLNILNL